MVLYSHVQCADRNNQGLVSGVCMLLLCVDSFSSITEREVCTHRLTSDTCMLLLCGSSVPSHTERDVCSHRLTSDRCLLLLCGSSVPTHTELGCWGNYAEGWRDRIQHIDVTTDTPGADHQFRITYFLLTPSVKRAYMRTKWLKSNTNTFPLNHVTQFPLVKGLYFLFTFIVTSQAIVPKGTLISKELQVKDSKQPDGSVVVVRVICDIPCHSVWIVILP